MSDRYNIQERCRKILEDNGGAIADKARTILLKDPRLKDLRAPLEFISKNWRDPLTPALINLSCKAVGESSRETCEAAVAMSLMHLSFHIWDDIIDKAPFKSFKPTLFGKFGEGPALVVGGLASAKAFSILNKMDIDKEKRQIVAQLFWELWAKMAHAETVNLRLRSKENFSSLKKFWKIKSEAAADLGACLRIGAILGNGSESEIKQMGRYGLYLGIILELWKDFHVSVNLTIGLATRIKNKMLPYFLLWAREHSEKVRKSLDRIANMDMIEPSVMGEIVEDVIETNALDYAVKTIRRLSKKGKESIAGLEQNSATRTLKLLVEAQPVLFAESLPELHDS